MAISRAQLAKELNRSLVGMGTIVQANIEIYTTESSDRAFEEEVMLSSGTN